VDEAARKSSEEVNEQEPRSPEEIRRDIKETREDLGDTAEALAGKADVKGQAKAKIEGMNDRNEKKVLKTWARASTIPRGDRCCSIARRPASRTALNSVGFAQPSHSVRTALTVGSHRTSANPGRLKKTSSALDSDGIQAEHPGQGPVTRAATSASGQ